MGGLNALISVELNTGNRVIVSDSTANGPQFEMPEGIAHHTEGAVAFITDSSLSALYAVDLISGERAIASR